MENMRLDAWLARAQHAGRARKQPPQAKRKRSHVGMQSPRAAKHPNSHPDGSRAIHQVMSRPFSRTRRIAIAAEPVPELASSRPASAPGTLCKRPNKGVLVHCSPEVRMPAARNFLRVRATDSEGSMLGVRALLTELELNQCNWGPQINSGSNPVGPKSSQIRTWIDGGSAPERPQMLCLTCGSDQQHGPQNATESVVNKRASRSGHTSFDTTLDHPLRRALEPCLIDLTPREAQEPWDPHGQLRCVALFRLHRSSPEPIPRVAFSAPNMPTLGF